MNEMALFTHQIYSFYGHPSQIKVLPRSLKPLNRYFGVLKQQNMCIFEVYKQQSASYLQFSRGVITKRRQQL